MPDTDVNMNLIPKFLVPVARAMDRNAFLIDITTPATVPEETAALYNEHRIQDGDFSTFLIPQARQLGRFGFKASGD